MLSIVVSTMHYPWPLYRLLLLAEMKGAEAGYSYQHYSSYADASHNEGERDRSKGSCCGETVMAR